MQRAATPADVAGETSWKIRRRGERRYPELYTNFASASIPQPQSGADWVLWKNDKGEYKDTYSSATI